MVLGIGLVLALGVALPRKEAANGSDESTAAPPSRVSGSPRQMSHTLTPMRPTARADMGKED
jgi:hypothetical protein